MSFKPAVRTKLRGRIALCGAAGDGKTYTAIRIARELSLADGGRGRIAVIDTEHRSATKYLGESPDGWQFEFDVCDLTEFSPQAYRTEILTAGRSGYDVLIIDSLSHAWMGEGGVLSIVDTKTAASRSKNAFTEGWREATPQHNLLVEALIHSPCHLIACMRSKMDYELEVGQDGKKMPVKIGMGPIQRAGIEYEFDIIGDLNYLHVLTVSKSRCSAIAGKTYIKPGSEFIGPIVEWLTVGSEAPDGYYAVTEADLTAVEKDRKKTERQQPKKQKSAKEIIEENAAKKSTANGQAATSSAAVNANLTNFANRWAAETDGRNRLPNTEATGTARSNGARPSGDSSQLSALEVPFDPQAAGMQEDLQAPCTDKQMDQIESLLARIVTFQKLNDAQSKKFYSNFQQQCLVGDFKVQKLPQLNKEQAMQVIEQLGAIESELTLGKQFDEQKASRMETAAVPN